MDSYDYLFFRLWRWHFKHFGSSDLPHLNAVLNLGVLAVLNWMTLQMGIRLFAGVDILPWNKSSGFVSVLVVGLIMYLVFFHKRRYQKIIDINNKGPADGSHVIGQLGMVYVVGTFVLLAVTSFFSWGINSR
jgi:hypothetical protein